MVIIDKDRLQKAYRTLGYYILWRKGCINGDSIFSPGEISDAMMAAAGAIQDLIAVDIERNMADKTLDTYRDMSEAQEKEIKRLRAILTRHKIKYAKVNK